MNLFRLIGKMVGKIEINDIPDDQDYGTVLQERESEFDLCFTSLILFRI